MVYTRYTRMSWRCIVFMFSIPLHSISSFSSFRLIPMCQSAIKASSESSSKEERFSKSINNSMSPQQKIQYHGNAEVCGPPPGEFRMAWFCPLVVEEQAAVAALTTEYAVDKDDYLQVYRLKGDRNIYTIGEIKDYKIVICRPSDTRAGPITAAMAWRDLQRSFPNIEYFLIVGM